MNKEYISPQRHREHRGRTCSSTDFADYTISFSERIAAVVAKGKATASAEMQCLSPWPCMILNRNLRNLRIVPL